MKTGEELLTLKGHTAGVNQVAVTRDGQWTVSASEDKTLKVWDLETGHELASLTGHDAGINGVALRSGRKYGQLAVSASDDGTLKVWNLKTRQAIARFVGESEFTCCAIAPSGTHILAGELSGRMHFLGLEGVVNK